MYFRLFLPAISLLATASMAAAAPFAYIANNADNTVTVIDTATNTVVNPTTPIALGGYNPYSIAVGRSGQYVYLTTQGTGANPVKAVKIIDAATKSVVGSLNMAPYRPGGLAVNPAETRVYVANNDSNTLSVWDIPTATEKARIQLSNSSISTPEGVVVNAAGTVVYVANAGTNTVTVLSVDETQEPAVYTKVAEVAVGSAPTGLVLDEANNKLYVSNLVSATVSVIDTTTNTTVGSDIAIGGGNIYSIAASSTTLYAPNTSDDNIYQINKSSGNVSVLTSVSGGFPKGIAVTPDGTKILVPLSNNNQVGIYNTAGTQLALLSVGAQPTGFGNFMGPALPYTITTSPGTNCIISPSGPVLANSYGRTFTIGAAAGYHVSGVTVGGGSVGTSLTQTVLPSANTTIAATCAPDSGQTYYTLTINNGPGGTLNSPSASSEYAAATSVPITVTPINGMRVQSWTGCTPANAHDTTCSVTMNSDLTVSVAYEPTPLSGPVKNATTGAFFSTIYAGCMDAGTMNGHTIQMTTALASAESLTSNYGKGTLTLKGGYDDETYNDSLRNGYTSLKSLVVGDTGFVVDRIVIN